MIKCPRCDNDTRTSGLVTEQGTVMLAGTIGTDPQPVLAQVCTACGHIDLYAPQPINSSERVVVENQPLMSDPALGGDAIPAA